MKTNTFLLGVIALSLATPTFIIPIYKAGYTMVEELIRDYKANTPYEKARSWCIFNDQPRWEREMDQLRKERKKKLDMERMASTERYSDIHWQLRKIYTPVSYFRWRESQCIEERLKNKGGLWLNSGFH